MLNVLTTDMFAAEQLNSVHIQMHTLYVTISLYSLYLCYHNNFFLAGNSKLF